MKSVAAILAWAIFLAASWTWCIGMYLPVILVRDYGIWAFVVFAVPNVAGAAAMAWVLPDAQASRSLVAGHATACRCFSMVTILFHCFFIFWIIFPLAVPIYFIGALLFLVLMAITSMRSNGRLKAAAAAMLVSIFAGARLWYSGEIPRFPTSGGSPIDLVGLSLVCMFGFTLCPYLDLTFHEARQATTPAGGRMAFAIGFGIFFQAMLWFTLGYSGWLAQSEPAIPLLVVVLLAFHFLVQTILKFALHGAMVGRFPAIMFVGIVAAALLGVAASRESPLYLSLGIRRLHYRPSFGEFIYGCFMAFYGLVFPAYVWICIYRLRSKQTWLIVTLIAVPMYWMGFVRGQTTWLLPGVAVPILAGWIGPKIEQCDGPRLNPAGG
jgi:hypothetical protein